MTGTDRKALLEFLRQSSLFADLSQSAFGAIGDRVRETHADRGMGIFDQDDPANRFFIVIDGWVKVYRITAAGEEAVIGVFTRGESFAEIAALAGETYPASATAITDLSLAEIPIRATGRTSIWRPSRRRQDVCR